MLLGIGIASVLKTIRRKADNFRFKVSAIIYSWFYLMCIKYSIYWTSATYWCTFCDLIYKLIKKCLPTPYSTCSMLPQCNAMYYRCRTFFFVQLVFTQVEMLAALFLMSSLLCTLITVSVLKFRLRRFYGIFLVGVYVVFLTVAILAEAKIFQISIPGVITVE